MKNKHIFIEDISIEVTFKSMKSLRLKFNKKNGEFKISAPKQMTLKQVNAFVSSKIDWIKGHHSSFKNNPEIKPFQFLEGESHMFLGEAFTLKFSDKPKDNRICTKTKQIFLTNTKENSTVNRQAQLEKIYRNELKLILPDLFNKWERIIGVKSNKITIRKMKSRWGSCNVVSRNISINLELIKQPIENLEHVIVHELCHIIVPNHSKAFYALLTKFQPEWETIDQDIKRHGIN
ncbi:MAG: M48 family metallopeptidase [Flavobacteriales bacterium]